MSLIRYTLFTAMIALPEIGNAAAKLDSGFLKNPAKPAATPVQFKAGPSKDNRTKKIAGEEKKADPLTLSATVETINSLTLILKTMPPGPGRDKILLNRAAALNLYGRLKVLAAKNPAEVAETRKWFLAAIKDSEELLTSKTLAKDQVLKAHDIAGTSYLHLDQYKESQSHFLTVLSMNPPDDMAGRLGLIVAEDYFDDGKYPEAAQNYAKYYSKMPPQWKELGMYKLAWCMLNMNHPDRAEIYLAQVAKSKSSSGVGRDALRDLAFVASHQPNALMEIEKTEGYFKDKADRLEFLHNVRVSLESQGNIPAHTVIVQKLLQLETDPDKRLELTIANLRVQKRLYAAHEHLAAFDAVVAEVQKLSPSQFKAIFPKYESVIEAESSEVMKSFIDTYAERVKAPEPFTKDEIVEALKRQFVFYHQYFSTQKNYPQVISLWSDICLERRDYVCMDQVSQVILAYPNRLGGFSERAYIDQLTALDQLIPVEQNNFTKKSMIERRNQRVHEFTVRFPKSQNWIRVAKLGAQIEMDQNHFKEAEPVLDQVMAAEPSANTFYLIQFSRFKQGEYEKILADPRNKLYDASEPKLGELYRESSLALAQKAKGQGNVDAYNQNIHSFLKYSTDENKSRIARADYVSYLLQNQHLDDALKEFFTFPEKDQKHPDLESSRVNLWKAAIEQGKFEPAQRISGLNMESGEWKQRHLLSRLFTGAVPTNTEFTALGTGERDYFLSLFALTKPEVVLSYCKSTRLCVDQTEKDLIALSYRVAQDEWRLARNPDLENMLGRDYPFVERASKTPLPVESLISAVVFSDLAKLPPARQSKAVQAALDRVHAVREKIIPSLQGKPAEVQARVFQKARDLENKMADYLNGSPVPKELTPEQVADYKKGIAGAAQEFTDQAKQFDLLASKASEEAGKSDQWAEQHSLPQPDLGRWMWPEKLTHEGPTQWIENLRRKGNQVGALALADYLRAQNIRKDEDFFAIRTGILLSARNSLVVRIYSLQELQKNKQTNLIQNWAKLVNRPVPTEVSS